ncbi:MAG: hypothetical protein FJZ90_02990 [Chloroflexi bacterium]|nr:hypothetical protein [Chloroflexota bacterium]
MMELFLSSDGKHTVHVAAQTPEELIQLLPQAKLVYEAVVRAYGGKSQTQKPANGNGNGKHHGEAPLCPVHKTPMAYREGRYGSFWSCPTRTADGGWCNCTFDPDGQLRTGNVPA